MNAQTAPLMTNRLLPLRLPRVCIAIVGDDPAEMLDKAEAMVRENPFFEFRLDYLKQPALALPKLKRFFELHPEVAAIATCRRVVNGGCFKGSVASQIEMLTKAIAAGCQLVDVELETAEAMKSAEWQKLRSRCAVILSHHDFRATRKLDDTFSRMQELKADYYKVVTTATRLYDNVTMVKFLEAKSHAHSVIGLCMGEQGIISRVLGLRAGSVFTFASANPGEETAPGQVSFRTLRDTYRVNFVDAATRVYGVVGDPVGHSLSPAMMNAAFRRENVNAVYLALHAKKLDDLVQSAPEIPVSGFSVTIPYKQEVIQHLDNTDVLTSKVGSCNTVVRGADGKLYGFNTDVAALVRPLEKRMSLANAKILVIGAGGAARSAVFGLKDRGAEVFIMNRTPATGQKLAKQAKAKYIKRADLKKHTFDAIINATPLGMEGMAKQSPLKENEIRAKYVFELIYTPAETPLVKMARAAGAQIIPGIEMFVQQGARQFEIWTGKPAPADEMQKVVEMELLSRAAKKNGNALAARKN
jgi:3-dehydroquinate dehydratase / shikimate dehydrogenase